MADKTDSATAYNDLLERAKQTSAKVSELEGSGTFPASRGPSKFRP